MHPHVATVLADLAQARADLGAAVAAIPPSLHARPPADGRWSVDQVLEHVSLVERASAARLSAAIAAAADLGPEAGPLVRLPDDRATQVRDRAGARRAPETTVPTGTVDTTTALQAIDDAHARLREAMDGAKGRALSLVTLDHRLFAALTVYQWIDVLAGHEVRHAAQIREIGAQLADL